MADTPEDDYDDCEDGQVCPRCMGGGTVDCHCGGDLCVCTNYGERDCPTCHGEGTVSDERAERYFAAQREVHRQFREMVERVEAEGKATEDRNGG